MSRNDSPTTPDSTAVFRQSWSVYQKFVTHNWMRHREVYTAVRKAATRIANGPLSVADFGCGDASCTIAALKGQPLRKFLAVDRVGALLATIPAQLAGSADEVQLVEGDLAEVVARPPEQPFDLLVVAFSLHHLDREAKGEFLAHARNWLRPRGKLLLIDLLLRPQETRRRFLDRFHRHAARHFRAFQPPEQQLVRDHMEACDFPESLATLQSLHGAAGLTSPRLAYRDPNEFYAVFTTSPWD